MATQAIAAPVHTSLWLPAVSLWWRELIRFFRQPSRWIGVLLSPVVFWLFIGAGLNRSFRATGLPDGHGYLEYLFPGTLVLILLFTSIFCMMSVIEDRREGFLRAVLVSPAPRASLALGKIIGGATLAVLQGTLFLLLAPAVGVPLGLMRWAAALGAMFLIAFGLTALGFLIAWRLDSTHGFHALVNLLLVPMWLMSGALFPVSGASAWVAWAMRLNPLTYGLALLRRALYQHGPNSGDTSLWAALVVMMAFSGAAFFAGIWLANRRDARSAA